MVIFKIEHESLNTKAYIQVNALTGNLCFTTYPEYFEFKVNTVLPDGMETPVEFTRFINGLAFADLSKLEVIIDQIEADIQEKIKNEPD